jgi:hypothetical protein
MRVQELLEAAKPKGTVDKNAGKERKASKATEKAGFKPGQRVAIDRGMGKTEHGNVHATGIKSGGDEGAMVHFADGKKEYHPYKSLKDAREYWDDADKEMREKRKK